VNFNSHLDSVVGNSVQLVNLVTAGEDRGAGYHPPRGRELREAISNALTGRRGWSAVPVAAVPILVGAGHALREVYEAAELDDLDRAATTLNRLMIDSGARPQLSRHDGEAWHLHFHPQHTSYASGWVASLATALAVVVGSEHASRLGVCSAASCDRVFVDVSRNGTRRFCSIACQNRIKAAAFRARQRAGGAG
jgi:hypothetical protein